MSLLSKRSRRYLYRAARGTDLYRGRELRSAYRSLLRGSSTCAGSTSCSGTTTEPGSATRSRRSSTTYRVTCDRDEPFIIDGGSNAGVSVAYFKQLYPNARILAFEPDPVSFTSLERNVTRKGSPRSRP